MTREEALLNAYLKGVKADQKKTVSAGTQAVSSAANEGVKTMKQAANVHIPSMYDYSKDMYKLIQDQQEEQIKAQKAAQRAAAAAAKKQQKEAEEKMKAEQEAQQKAQEEAQEEAASDERQNAFLARAAAFQRQNSLFGETAFQKPKTPEELQNEARQNYYDTTRRMGEISSKINSLDGEEGKLMSRREKAAEKKDLEAELEKISDSLRPIVKQLPDDERAAAYAESWYVLSDEEKKDAKQLAKNYTSREYVQSIYDPVTKTNRPKEFQMNQIGEKLKFKTSLAGGFWSGLVSSIPFYNESVEKYSPEIYDTLQAAKTQNPKSSIAGNIAGSLGGYALGSAAVKAIPGVGAAAAKAGQALGATKGAAQLQKIPVLGRAFTGEALTGIIADQMADTVLDTVPTAVQSAREDNPAAKVAWDTAVNFGTNALLNVGAEGVLGTVGDALKRRQNQRIPVVENIEPPIKQPSASNVQTAPNMQAAPDMGTAQGQSPLATEQVPPAADQVALATEQVPLTAADTPSFVPTSSAEDVNLDGRIPVVENPTATKEATEIPYVRNNTPAEVQVNAKNPFEEELRLIEEIQRQEEELDRYFARNEERARAALGEEGTPSQSCPASIRQIHFAVEHGPL